MKKPSPLKSERAALINAIHRCHNDQHAAYFNYGARGITVHDDWRGPTGFANFIAHIGAKPHPELTLDRIDNDSGYQPGNVRWATRKEQMANQRPRFNYAGVKLAARDAEILRLWNLGVSQVAMMSMFRLSRSQIYRICRKGR